MKKAFIQINQVSFSYGQQKILNQVNLTLEQGCLYALIGGERQRVALARTLIGGPNLLLMDEPTSALDAMTKEELQGIILREQQKRKATLLFVTHDIEEAMMLGKKILLINREENISILENPYYSIQDDWQSPHR